MTGNMNYVLEAQKLKKQADDILAETNILGILSDFGKPVLTGSYTYNLLTRRDIDICLVVSRPTPELMFKLGSRIAALPNIGSMYFRDEFVLQTKGNPKAMFWCIELLASRKRTWSFDILVADTKTVNRVTQPGIKMMKKMTAEKRKIILNLKGRLCRHEKYRIDFRSTDIYEAVLKHNISSLREWKKWFKATQANK